MKSQTQMEKKFDSTRKKVESQIVFAYIHTHTLTSKWMNWKWELSNVNVSPAYFGKVSCKKKCNATAREYKHFGTTKKTLTIDTVTELQ